MTRGFDAADGSRDEAPPPTLFRFTTSTRVLLVLAVLAFATTAVWAARNGQPAVAVAAIGPILAVAIGVVVARTLRSGAFSRAEDDAEPQPERRP